MTALGILLAGAAGTAAQAETTTPSPSPVRGHHPRDGPFVRDFEGEVRDLTSSRPTDGSTEVGSQIMLKAGRVCSSPIARRTSTPGRRPRSIKAQRLADLGATG